MLLRTRQFAAFLIHCDGWIGDDSMRRQAGFFDVDDRLKRLSDLGDQLEAFEAAVEFEAFRPELNAGLTYSEGTQGGRPPFDPVMMFKILVIQTTNNLSDERAEFLINDRLSFMRFLGFGLSDRVPDARTIWLFREKLTKAGAIGPLFERFDATLRQSGYIAMSGQIVDASLIAAPRQRNTQDEKKAIKDGPHPRRLERQAREASPEGSRRALDSQIHQRQIKNPFACRACLCRAKGSDGFVHPDHRDRESEDEDRTGEPRLQYQTPALPAAHRGMIDRCLRQGLLTSQTPRRSFTSDKIR